YDRTSHHRRSYSDPFDVLGRQRIFTSSLWCTGSPDAGSKVRAVGFDLLLGISEEALERVQWVAGLGDAVGVVKHVNVPGAVGLRGRAEAEGRSVGLEVGAEKVSARLELIPEAHRLADLVGDLGRDGGVRERRRAVDGGLGPGGQSLVEPWIASLVITD